MINKFKLIIFDMDGTIVESYLDFQKIRDDLGIDHQLGILEYIEQLEDQSLIEEAQKIVHKHELSGARKSVLMRDFLPFYNELKDKRIPIGLLTRNSKLVTEMTLAKHNLKFDIVLTRDCCKVKPHPEGLLRAAKKLRTNTQDILYIGDYLFDLETAKNANTKSALILNDRNAELKQDADISFTNYKELYSYIF